MITAQEAAARLNGCEYCNEGDKELFAAMKTAGLVAIFGASDDLIEFRGAIHDEIGSFDGGTAYITSAGLLFNDCDNDDCPNFERAKVSAAEIHALWASEGDYSWTYKTAIPHDTFEIVEDGGPYCRGIVFALSNVPPAISSQPTQEG